MYARAYTKHMFRVMLHEQYALCTAVCAVAADVVLLHYTINSAGQYCLAQLIVLLKYLKL
jgi:hypothetical protein